MSVKVLMNVSPNSAAQFRAYMTAENEVLNYSAFEGSHVDATITFTEIQYIKPRKGIAAKWVFSGRNEFREFRHMGQGNGFAWVTVYKTAFVVAVSKPQVDKFIAQKFS